ncbi:MAG: glycosyltransferase family 39 protein, partial [Armatimonadota bacterium]
MLLRLAAVVVIAVGFLLRFYGIGWSLPSGIHLFSYHPDEILIVGTARNLSPFEGQLNPHFFNYGSLYLYLISLALPAARALLSNSLYTDYLTARLIAAVMGGATVWLVYLLGRKVASRGVGLMAATLMAIMPLHVMHSHYAAVDVPAGFWVVVSLLGAVHAASDSRARWYVLAGIGAGFAAATKYNCALVVLAAVGAYVLSRLNADTGQKPGFRLLILLFGVLALSFLVGTPGVLLAPDEFWRDFSYEMWHTRTGHGLVFSGTGSGWWYHLAHNLRYGLGLPMLVACLAGVAVALWRRHPTDVVLLSFCIPYYAVIGGFEVRFMRYLIPLLPAMAVLCAEAVAWMCTGEDRSAPLRRRLTCTTAGLVAGAATGWTVLYVLAHVLLFTGIDPRDAARSWMLLNARGRTVGITTEPWFYSPPLSRYNGGPQSARSFWR